MNEKKMFQSIPVSTLPLYKSDESKEAISYGGSTASKTPFLRDGKKKSSGELNDGSKKLFGALQT